MEYGREDYSFEGSSKYMAVRWLVHEVLGRWFFQATSVSPWKPSSREASVLGPKVRGRWPLVCPCVSGTCLPGLSFSPVSPSPPWVCGPLEGRDLEGRICVGGQVWEIVPGGSERFWLPSSGVSTLSCRPGSAFLVLEEEATCASYVFFFFLESLSESCVDMNQRREGAMWRVWRCRVAGCLRAW